MSEPTVKVVRLADAVAIVAEAAADARREALEEAAKACDEIDGRGRYTDTDLDDAFNSGLVECAEAIRALKDKP